MSKTTVRIGTRGSKLALYQAEQVKKIIENRFPEIVAEIKIINTRGDQVLDVALSKIGDKGLFTKELENELISGEIDMAVHSLKDLPTELPDIFTIGAVLERADFRDALVSKDHRKLKDLTSADIIATSSLRRKAGLLCINPDFQIVDIRGNVNTRLKKMEDGYCDAIIMAAAGLQRLGLDSYITEILEPEVMIPAVSQGIIAIETRKRDEFVNSICNSFNHQPTMLAASAERAFMRTLQGGCQVPVGCYTRVNGENFSITGFVASVDGKEYLKEELTDKITEAEKLGEKLAVSLLNQGGDAILKSIRIG